MELSPLLQMQSTKNSNLLAWLRPLSQLNLLILHTLIHKFELEQLPQPIPPPLIVVMSAETAASASQTAAAAVAVEVAQNLCPVVRAVTALWAAGAQQRQASLMQAPAQ